MNSNTDLSSNNGPPEHQGITDLHDIDISIDISLNSNSNSTGANYSIYNETIKNYAVQTDIENGLDNIPYSLKARTSNLACSTVKYASYPEQRPTKSLIRGRSTFRSILKDVSDRNSVSDYYTDEQKSKWLNNTKVPEKSVTDYFMFYLNSLRNNKQYKFRYIEFVGELNTINEYCDNIIGLLLEQLEEENSVASIGHTEENLLSFLNSYDDKLTECLYKIDHFLTNNIGFMKLCSAPVDLFLDKYYCARNNSCGLIKHTQFSSSYDCLCREEIKVNNYYIPYVDCVDVNVKNTYKWDLEDEIYMHCSTRKNVSIRRIAAIHTLFGELRALCEFIKTTIELNDQLLFKVIMLCGNFLVLLGEYVWNTTLKQRYAD